MSEEKEALRKLIMLISDLRAKDEERYEAHVNFMNETIKMISAIESQMNKHWSTVLESLNELNESISANLDSLLTGINPKGLRETSKSLKEIMDTMNKSVQTMSLEKVMSELKVLKTGDIKYATIESKPVARQPEQISAGMSINPTSLQSQSSTEAPKQDSDWVDPHEKAKKEEEDQHLLKPSDFFGN
ncbi:MAG: hypothetical protein ACW986_01070 [Promethearchaeota archaeon]|jgi:hypothetical protein